MRHVRACLGLFAATVLVCCVAYPVALWVIGQAVFAGPARGSLVDRMGRPALAEERAVGSRLIAQPFAGDGYFHPRPSAVSYDASASGASNWAASNYRLRERVAQALGPVATYAGPGARAGQPVGPDIEAWLHANPGAAAAWAEAHPEAPARWLKADPDNAKLVAAWKHKAGMLGDPEAGEVAPFFAALAVRPVAQWPEGFGPAVQAVFFESWHEARPEEALTAVPADAVMASGSGLDPHITVDNALWQLGRVVAARAAATGGKPDEVRGVVEGLVRERAERPLGGLAGVPLVNVLELNLELDRRLGVDWP